MIIRKKPREINIISSNLIIYGEDHGITGFSGDVDEQLFSKKLFSRNILKDKT